MNIQPFLAAMARQTERKAFFPDGIESPQTPLMLALSITEEAGEVAAALARQRTYAAVAECVDVATSALLLAAALDPDGEVLRRIATEHRARAAR